MKKLILALAAAGLSIPAFAGVTTVYSNDFSAGAGSAWSSSAVTTSSTGQKFLGEFSNDSTTLTLNNLAAHNAVTLSFDLYILKSWDGDSFSGVSPDIWGITLNGATSINSFTTTFSNGYGATQSYPSAYFVGQAAARTGSIANDTLGYGSGVWGDSVYHMSFTTTHTASTFTAKLFGANLQGVSDESWGVDNVSVSMASVTAVPEPETYSLLLAGLGVMGAVARRRKQK